MKSVLIFLFFSVVLSFTLFSVVKVATTTEPDFSIFYTSSKDVLNHINPYADKSLYTAFNYPLATAVLFLPLAILPFRESQIIFTLFSLFFAGCIVYFSYKLLRKPIPLSAFFLIASLFFVSFPFKFTIGMGQTNLIAYGLLLGGFLAFQKKHIAISIVLLVIAILFKPILGLTLLVFLFEEEWRYFIFLVLLALFSIFIIPFITHLSQSQFFTVLLHQSLLGREVYYNQGFMGWIARIVSDVQARFIFTFAGILFISIFTLRKIIHIPSTERLSLLLTTLLLIDPLSWQHHFVFLLLPFLTVWFALQRYKKRKTVFYILYFLAYVLALANFKNPQPFESFPLSLLLSNQFYAALILFCLQLKLL